MPVTVERCDSVADAAKVLAARRGAHVIGGGTVLMRAVNEADPSVGHIVRVSDPQLTRIAVGGGGLTIGAAVTMAQLIANRDAAFLAPVARVIGGPQVRAAATVAGNLFAPRPYGDLAGALLALDAAVETADGRRLGIAELLTATGARPFVTAIHVPDPRGAFHFRKVTRVKPKGVSLMSIAVCLPRQGGRIETPHVVFNGMGPHPVRAPGAERALGGRTLDAAAIDAAATSAAEGLAPPDDAHASAWYRRQVAGVHLARLLQEVR